MNAAGLAAQQAALQGWLLHAAPGVQAHISGRDAVERGQRLRIYADAYRWRLVQVLAEDYPALRAALGQAAFSRLAQRYLAVRPSRHPSVRWLGAGFADWLRSIGQPSSRVALARLEWAQGEVFDAADATACDIDVLLALSPLQWSAMRLRLVPALRLLAGIGNAPRRAHALIEGLAPPRWRRTPGYWLVWRHALDVHWRALPGDEAAALACVAAGGNFAEACAVIGGADPALRAASLLKRWIADGLVGCVEVDDVPPVDSFHS